MTGDDPVMGACSTDRSAPLFSQAVCARYCSPRPVAADEIPVERAMVGRVLAESGRVTSHSVGFKNENLRS